MKQLNTYWTQDLPEDKKEDFEKTLRNSTTVTHRLLEIVEKWEKSILSEERSKDQYKTPAWQALQAHRNGSLEITQKLKDLLNFV